jgi:hypothetical protein
MAVPPIGYKNNVKARQGVVFCKYRFKYRKQAAREPEGYAASEFFEAPMREVGLFISFLCVVGRCTVLCSRHRQSSVYS